MNVFSSLSNLPKKIGAPIKLLLPFLFWVFLFKDFISGKITLNIDAFGYYAYTKYYINNIINGIVPIWNPFLWLGEPLVYISMNGSLNPMIYLIVFLKFLGLNYYTATVIYIILYYFFGLVGFYCLAKIVLKNNFFAFFAYVLLLFSGLGTASFNQMNLLLIFVPSVWFFFFLFSFGKSFKKSCFFGLTLSLMSAVTSYIPFHFLTLFLVFALLYAIFYPRRLKKVFFQFKDFIKCNKACFFICLLALCIVSIPAFLTKFVSHSNDIVTPARHCEQLDASRCVEETLSGRKAMTYSEAVSGTLGWRMSFWSLFAHLDKVNYSQDGWFYVSGFAYLLLFVAMFTLFDRKKLFVLIFGFIIFLISLGDATPIHKFLFLHVFYFQDFRNLFYFMAFMMPILTLFVALQLQSILQLHQDISPKDRTILLIEVFILHIVFLAFLLWCGNVPSTASITVFGSLLLFCLYFGGYLDGKKIILVSGLIILGMISPIEIFRAYRNNALAYQCHVSTTHARPDFTYQRIDEIPEDGHCRIFWQVPKYREFEYLAAMKDSMHFVGSPGTAARWVYLLFQYMDTDVLRSYAKNKLVLYDHVELLEESKDNIMILSEAFQKQKNTAYVSEKIPSTIQGVSHGATSETYTVVEESDHFRVTHFDVNSVAFHTNFPVGKFLVYNDAYNSHWTLTINGLPGKIYRANLAFKGVWLPSGENTVRMRFEPPGGVQIYVFVTVCFFLFFIYTLWILHKEKVFEALFLDDHAE